jgi:hypothetical protein
MIYKRFYEITIRDYNIIEQSGKINHLIKWSFVPVFLVSKFILKEIEKANKLLNAEVEDDNEELKWKIESLAKIAAIQSNVLGLYNLLNLGVKINLFKDELKPHYKRKIKITDKNVKHYIENLSTFTGIKIVTLEDLAKVVKELEFRKDKFHENFSKPKQSGKVYLMQVVLGVFSYLNQSVNVDMTISEFAIIRDEANEKLKREKVK